MAAGDVTATVDVFGTKIVVSGTIEGPASYAAGGFALNDMNGVTDAALAGAGFGLASIEFISFELVEQDADEAFVARLDRATKKVQVYECLTADALQEIGAEDLSSLDIRFFAFGRKSGNLS